MSKKSKKSADNGTYALCISVGLIVGLGLGPLLSSVAYSALGGLVIGAIAGYYFTHQKSRSKRH